MLDLAMTAERSPQTAAIEYLGSLVRLVAASELAQHGEVEAIDAVLGCPIALADTTKLLKFENEDRSDFFQMPAPARFAACLAHKHAIDVVRELINVFIVSLNEEYRWKIGKRLSLIHI